MNKLARFLPFLRWFPMNGDTVKSDFMAGITVALVLIPQSMAYAQLAGLPVVYGLWFCIVTSSTNCGSSEPSSTSRILS